MTQTPDVRGYALSIAAARVVVGARQKQINQPLFPFSAHFFGTAH